ncbi:MAG: hypothetical protein ABIT06_00505 [Saprospiraceae bacterium]
MAPFATPNMKEPSMTRAYPVQLVYWNISIIGSKIDNWPISAIH